MELFVARTAGFCFGVSRAVETVYKNIDRMSIVTYGPIIHNQIIVDDLKAKGVEVIEDIENADGRTVVIRSHGVGPDIYDVLDKKAINYIDCTCPDVKKIHELAEQCKRDGRRLIIAGDRRHPEVIGIQGYAGEGCVVVANAEEVRALNFDCNDKYVLVAQTTLQKEIFAEVSEALGDGLDIKTYNTICRATLKRQEEAEELSKKVDKMLVLGDATSSNSAKLYSICKRNCKNTYFVGAIGKLQLNIFDSNDKIGLTAGASTPPAIIKEAVKRMSEMENGTIEAGAMENEMAGTAEDKIIEATEGETIGSAQSFQEMLDESFVTLHTGDVVKGTVIQVTNGEVSVNLGYKSDGTIPKGEFSENPDIDPAQVVKPGDIIETFVVKVSDLEGNVTLSRKKLEMQKGYADLEAAFNEKTPIKGKVVEIVKGGLIANINGVRVFVPSSHASNRYVQDLNVLKGKEFNFSIIEYDRSKRRLVASRKELAAIEENEMKERIFGSLEIGQRAQGVVSRVVEFGAFVDLGGIDGLIHISEMSWGRIRKVSDVLSEGDQVTVTVLDINKAKGKISLSLKDVSSDPWKNVSETFPIGSIVEGKVVRLVSFGAFVELAEGVDGLVHISQIARKHVVKPEDELEIGQVIKVKVIEVDENSKKISLSKKEADGISVEYDQEHEQDGSKYSESSEENLVASEAADEMSGDMDGETIEEEIL